MNKLNLALVDDHEIFRKGLVLLLKSIENVGNISEASNGKEFLEMIEEQEFDVIFMDVKMPIMNGIEATKLALLKKPSLKIIGLSMFGEEEYLESMIESGVEGFLLKKADLKEIEKAINLIAAGKNYFSEELVTSLTKKFGNSGKNDNSGLFTVNSNESDKISKREIEILQLICKGFSNQEIAEKLFISPRTVDGHRANIISKTGVKNTANLVMYAIKNGLVKI
jgi:DNA-binding NarL/FixJ family response regulator